MKDFIIQLFTWWNGQTPGTRFHTWRHGQLVGSDEFGNRYYHDASGERRWVIYQGEVDASAIPPAWHGWMHHRRAHPPSQGPQDARREWQLPAQANMTGTAAAYRPEGSVFNAPARRAISADYAAWTPDQPARQQQ